MAANDGTNAGSAPEGDGVGVAVSLADGFGDGDVPEVGDPLGVDVGAGLTAAVGVHPPRTIAIEMAAQA